MELRFENVGARKIAARAGVFACRSDAPEPTPSDIEYASENRRTIKPGPAKPIERTALRDQSCRAAVTDNPIIANGRCDITSVEPFRENCALHLISGCWRR